jgi:hypothetical protein
VYGDFKLIVELSHDAHWFWAFWRAESDTHGTSSNKLVMMKLVTWKDGVVSNPNGAQITYAQTIPVAVARAVSRHPWPDPAVWYYW